MSTRLFQACRITLFTRENCGLCTQARSVLSNVWDARPFAFKEIDIIKPDSKAWRDLYDFDVPVVGHSFSPILLSPRYAEPLVYFGYVTDPHQQSPAAGGGPKALWRGGKMMHRFTAEEVKAKMDIVERA